MKKILSTFAMLLASCAIASAQDGVVGARGGGTFILLLIAIPLILGIAFLIYSKSKKK